MTTAIASPCNDRSRDTLPSVGAPNNGSPGKPDSALSAPNAPEGFVMVAQAIYLVNRAAKVYQSHPIRWGLYDAKSAMVSALLENAIAGVVPAWDLERTDDELLKIAIANHTRVHCPIRRLTPIAQRKVLDRIGLRPH